MQEPIKNFLIGKRIKRLDRVPSRGVTAASILALRGGFGPGAQAAAAGSLRIGSSLNGAMVSSVM
jgi:hypothetical protein